MLRTAAVFQTVLLALLIGCNGGGEGMLQVTGEVRFEGGQPVIGEYATIAFQPATSNNGSAASMATGVLKEDGTFDLMTSQPGDGVFPGDYKVVLTVYTNYRNQELGIPARYTQHTTTPLTATVAPGSTEFKFTVER